MHQARRGGRSQSDADWAFQCAVLRHLESMWQRAGSRPLGGARRAAPLHVFKGHGLGGLRSRHPRHRAVQSVGTGRSLAPDPSGDSRRGVRARIRSRAGILRAVVRLERARRQPAAAVHGGLSSPEDPRIRGTIEAVEKRLFSDGFLLRYDTRTTDDGLPEGEGAFLACSFWLADAYALVGRVDEALSLCKRLIALGNDVGLLAEEYDTRAGRMVGNFPQAFSHVALVNTTHNLLRATKPAEQRAAS